MSEEKKPSKKKEPSQQKRPPKEKKSEVRRNYLLRIPESKAGPNPESESGFPLIQVWDEKDYIIPANLNPYIDHPERLYPLDELVRAFYPILDDDHRSNNTFLPIRCASEPGINNAEESMENLLNEAVAAVDAGELPAQRTEPPHSIRSLDFVSWLDVRYGLKNEPWIGGLMQASMVENRHSDDFTKVRWYERDFRLSKKRAAIVRCLWDAGDQGVPWHALKAEASITGEDARMEKTFTGLANWRELVESNPHKRGRWRMRRPN